MTPAYQLLYEPSYSSYFMALYASAYLDDRKTRGAVFYHVDFAVSAARRALERHITTPATHRRLS